MRISYQSSFKFTRIFSNYGFEFEGNYRCSKKQALEYVDVKVAINLGNNERRKIQIDSLNF